MTSGLGAADNLSKISAKLVDFVFSSKLKFVY